jgi:hypothetical protein
MELKESYWIATTINIGTIKRNKTVQLAFQALPTVPKIKKLAPACGCTSVQYLEESRQLMVTFKSGEFPKHIIADEMGVKKNIKITYTNKEEEVLSLIGTKIR